VGAPGSACRAVRRKVGGTFVVTRPVLFLARLRLAAARVSLVVYLAAALAAPLGHLATHRDDHTHGPEPGRPGQGAFGTAHGHAGDDARDGALAGAHARAHALGLDHDHDDDHQAAVHDPADHDEADHEHGDDTEAPRVPLEHGQQSPAHFGLAVLEGPPPPFLPPPPSTLAPSPDTPVHSHEAPALPQPPARGPPPLA